ncbi:MAG: hypothetical protein CO120_03220 [Gammaproteobacteria bacterium CG_4_9_14_3_um_filter_38_9]|nr:MAG: hypothetical protein CO120_03220 [Gammaproteobacteria bacterium CG_4_9_14_3_um_filter_38_9]
MATEFDWKKTVGAIAPTLATMLGGPLAGTAVAALSNIFFGTGDKSEAEVQQAVLTGLTPEKIVEMRKIDKEHEATMAKIGFDYAKLSTSQELAYVDDTKDARKYKDDKTFWLGVVILLVFALTMSMSLYGSYQILQGGITVKDVSIVAAVSGFIGSIIGYISANAQQVVSYFYGSSSGSKQKTDAMTDSFKSIKIK